MALKFILAGLTLAAAAVVGCESNDHDHRRSDRDYRKDRIGYDPGRDRYDRYGRYDRWDRDARPAGARIDPHRDRDWDRNRNPDWDRDRDRDGSRRPWDPNRRYDRDKD